MISQKTSIHELIQDGKPQSFWEKFTNSLYNQESDCRKVSSHPDPIICEMRRGVRNRPTCICIWVSTHEYFTFPPWHAKSSACKASWRPKVTNNNTHVYTQLRKHLSLSAARKRRRAGWWFVSLLLGASTMLHNHVSERCDLVACGVACIVASSIFVVLAFSAGILPLVRWSVHSRGRRCVVVPGARPQHFLISMPRAPPSVFAGAVPFSVSSPLQNIYIYTYIYTHIYIFTYRYQCIYIPI